MSIDRSSGMRADFVRLDGTAPGGGRGGVLAVDQLDDSGVPVRRELIGTVHAPRVAREFVRRVCAGHPRLEDLALICSELVTNAVRHADAVCGRGVSVLVMRVGAAVRIEVIDAGRGGSTPHIPALDGLAESGRGLRLVDDLAEGRWGHHRDERGRTVWVEIVGS
jgi:anti-sigma regulatory factor (Ser/Thr protein kinase)